MKVRDILDDKGRQVVTIAPDHSVRDAARMFVRHGIGALPVVEDGELRGLVSIGDALEAARGTGSGDRGFRRYFRGRTR